MNTTDPADLSRALDWRLRRALGRQAAVPAYVLTHPDLNATAVRVFGLLCLAAEDPTGTCPTREELAATCHVRLAKIDRAVQSLFDVGALSRDA